MRTGPDATDELDHHAFGAPLHVLTRKVAHAVAVYRADDGVLLLVSYVRHPEGGWRAESVVALTVDELEAFTRNAKVWGARGDGLHDDAPALQRAMNANVARGKRSGRFVPVPSESKIASSGNLDIYRDRETGSVRLVVDHVEALWLDESDADFVGSMIAGEEWRRPPMSTWTMGPGVSFETIRNQLLHLANQSPSRIVMPAETAAHLGRRIGDLVLALKRAEESHRKVRELAAAVLADGDGES